jgi:FtsH-binding integral membrane protein
MFTEISWRIGYVVLSTVGIILFELLITHDLNKLTNKMHQFHKFIN